MDGVSQRGRAWQPVAATPFYFVWWASIAHHKSTKSKQCAGVRHSDLANRWKKSALSI
ncbi:hypothetical protein MPL1032_130078 [Mesorhizobium plurifarium]|uniref:Uncharacterized protein n=1 Tax=Mesorhizobium plurifarium TaxID=69974 RepID=A0A0K2VQZ8_MESPL|nr:hypothetical protein MPL1032_130078 [Mesorhizobium plurifarium]